MAKKRLRISKRVATPTAWQALNTPIAYPSNEFARSIFLAATIIMLMVWLMPYWSQAPPEGSPAGQVYRLVLSRAEGPINGQATDVAVPDWYYTAQRASSDLVNAFAVAAEEVLDISEQITPTVEFYEPGVEAVWGAWLELMDDPYPAY